MTSGRRWPGGRGPEETRPGKLTSHDHQKSQHVASANFSSCGTTPQVGLRSFLVVRKNIIVSDKSGLWRTLGEKTRTLPTRREELVVALLKSTSQMVVGPKS